MDAVGSGIAAEDGGEGGEGEKSFLSHGFDGVPHGVEELVLAEEVNDEVPGVGGVVIVKLDAGPPEEFDGGTGEGVGELEDLLDVLWRNPNAGVVEKLLDGRGGGGGDDFAEEF